MGNANDKASKTTPSITGERFEFRHGTVMRKNESFHLEHMKFSAKKIMKKHPGWVAHIC